MREEFLMRITAAQHVSGILRAEQSPRGQGGYQILLSTGGLLNEDEIRLIERRVKYSSAQDEKGKWQYYRLPNYKPVISRILPITEPDEFGRGGRYLAHSLIFSVSDSQQVDEGLFNLLRPDHFFSSLNHVLACDGLKTGYIRDTTVEIGKGWTEEAKSLIRGWPGEELNRLSRLISDPKALIDQEHYVALIGSESQILDALKVAFLLASPSVRRLCSFDTNAFRCEWPRDTVFWARGFPAAEASSPFVIDAAQRKVRFPESFSLPPSASGNWIEAEVRAQRYNGLSINLPRARALAALIRGESTNLKLLKSMEEEFEKSFADANIALIKEAITNFFPKEFSPALRQAIVARLIESPVNLLRWLVNNQYAVYIREPAYQALLVDRDLSLTGNELELLSSWAKTHHGLGLLITLKTGNERQRLQVLSVMPREEYIERVKELMTCAGFKAWQVFSPAHLNSWFYLCRGVYDMEDIYRAIAGVAEHGSKQDRQQVEYIYSLLSPHEGQELLNWIKSSAYHLPKLQAALNGFAGSSTVSPSAKAPLTLGQRLKETIRRYRKRG
jgi:hypothetical protein